MPEEKSSSAHLTFSHHSKTFLRRYFLLTVVNDLIRREVQKTDHFFPIVAWMINALMMIMVRLPGRPPGWTDSSPIEGRNDRSGPICIALVRTLSNTILDRAAERRYIPADKCGVFPQHTMRMRSESKQTS